MTNVSMQSTNDTFRTTSRPKLDKDESLILAKKLFSLQEAEDKEIKELDSYEDRNFLIKGSLNKEASTTFFVLKIINSSTSKNVNILQALARVLPFIHQKNDEIGCPVPQTSIYGAKYVFCRIAEQTDNATADSKMISITDRIQVVSDISGNDICAVFLLSFIPGEVICDVEWTGEILCDFGFKMACFTNILKEYSESNAWITSAKLQNTDYHWLLATFAYRINHYIDVVQDKERQEEIQNIIDRFVRDVLVQLDTRDFQLVHADFNEHNVIVGPNKNGNIEVKGFIDFSHMQYSHRLLCLGIACAYLMIEANKKGYDIIEASSHVIAGYQLETVLTDSDLEKVLITAKTRVCQSLVIGLYQHQLTPDNHYTLYTQKSGWETLSSLQSKEDSYILAQWKNNKSKK